MNGVLPAPPRPREPVNSNQVEKIIDSELYQLKDWAMLNRRDAKTDKRNFWMLKIPAINRRSWSICT